MPEIFYSIIVFENWLRAAGYNGHGLANPENSPNDPLVYGLSFNDTLKNGQSNYLRLTRTKSRFIKITEPPMPEWCETITFGTAIISSNLPHIQFGNQLRLTSYSLPDEFSDRVDFSEKAQKELSREFGWLEKLSNTIIANNRTLAYISFIIARSQSHLSLVRPTGNAKKPFKVSRSDAHLMQLHNDGLSTRLYPIHVVERTAKGARITLMPNAFQLT
ncbi:MAG: hypothetical protein MRY32_00115 [Rickettsiales bacterium]|nr:hypothetical protein [Rickettsiales bacterium]